MAFNILTRRAGAPYDPDDLTREINENFAKTAEVTLDSVTNGELLTYNSSSETWENSTIVELGVTLEDLSDTSISSPADGEFLVYDSSSSSWINGEGSIVATLDDLTDVDTTGVSDGDIITYNASTSSWVVGAGGGGSSTLADLTDTTITSPANGEILIYNGSAWVNQAGTNAIGERTYTDTVTVSAASSATWAIPNDCVRVSITGSQITGTSTNALMNVVLVQAADSADASFEYIATNISNQTAVSTTIEVVASARSNDTTSTEWGLQAEIEFPRDSLVKTRAKTCAQSVGDQTINTEAQIISAVCDVAEDHDTIRFEVNAGTMTGDFQITYTVLEYVITSAAPSTVAGLPSGSVGKRAFVTDATSTTFASIVAGGGSNGVPVYYDGTNWRVG